MHTYAVVSEAVTNSTTFPYSNKLNLIVTGGQDALVRVWNPYVTKKPISILRGHQSPVTQVNIVEEYLSENPVTQSEDRSLNFPDLGKTSMDICIDRVP